MSSETAAPLYDVAIVGAGAAGLMAGIFCAGKDDGPLLEGASRKVLLLDGKEKPAAKILISGGCRCNITNRVVTERDYAGGRPHTVRNILRAFSAEKTVQFFETLGIECVDQGDGQLFPRTQRAQTVRDALLDEAGEKGVSLKTLHKVTALQYQNGVFRIFGIDFHHESRTVILCTGGLSYPETGSDGSGYRLAQGFGHTVIQTVPALAPLLSADPEWLSLTGISVPCRLMLSVEGKKVNSSEGALLFTHTGFSGPCVLDISRHWGRAKERFRTELAVNFMPDFNEQEFRDILTYASKEEPGYTLKNFLTEKLPERLAEVLFSKISVSEQTILNQLKREDRENLVRILYHCPLPIRDIGGYDKAEVTAGGVNLDEVDPHTLESKFQPGLFFAGEILDVDGRIGGFNLQWAWSSAAAAAAGAVNRSRPKTR